MNTGKFFIYNTATRTKEEFVPASDSEELGLYCCGPTVYNYAHIGNLRTYIFEDVLKRILINTGYRVKHVVNITDVGHLTSDADTGEDKMEEGASREKRSVWDIAEFYTQAFMKDIECLNILEADVWPRATQHIQDMIEEIRALEEKGYTYKTSDGIYFDTSKFDRYCDFARLDPDSLNAGARISMGEKRRVTDFALWKFSPKDKQRQMEWESPWGTGFPGWHIECSVMSAKYLNLPIDIHCGGADHIKVHHTNEIAQAEAARDQKFVNYWLHGEWLVIDNGGMSKSSGNFITMESITERGIDPLAYRLYCYSAHYRSQLTFSWDALEGADRSLRKLRKAVADLPDSSEGVASEEGERYLKEFFGMVLDDMNMSGGVASLWGVVKSRDLSGSVKKDLISEMDKYLGLDLFSVQKGEDQEGNEKAFSNGRVILAGNLGNEDFNRMVVEKAEKRAEAREEKDYALADSIRDELTGKG
ncbi:MAG: cysteine--tRNA ligase, partial [Chitinivibrionales bacterium]